MPSRQLYLHIRDLLHVLHKDPENSVLVTLALLVTGLILGRSVQFWEVAVWMPADIQLLSAVRRFERFVANPAVQVATLFEPFVLAMQASLRTRKRISSAVSFPRKRESRHSRWTTAGHPPPRV